MLHVTMFLLFNYSEFEDGLAWQQRNAGGILGQIAVDSVLQRR